MKVDSTRFHVRMMLGCLAGFVAVILLLRAQDGGRLPEGEDSGPGMAPPEEEVAPKGLLSQENGGTILKRLGEFLPRNHLLLKRFDTSMSAVAWTNFVTSLDFDRSYFLQSDINRFEEMRERLGEVVKSGDAAWAYEVFEVYKERLADRYVFVTNGLAQAMDFTREEFYDWNRRHVAWPATAEERDDLWRRRIKNEYLGYVISKEIDQEAASNRVAKATTEDMGVEPQIGQMEQIVNATTEEVLEEIERVVETEEEVLEAGAEEKAVADAKPAVTNAPAITPEEFVAKRYRQLKTVIDDYDADFVFQRFASAIVSAYDPHSDYMSPAKAEDFNIDMSLSLSGIGAQLRSEDGTAMVVELIPGGPAERDTRDIRLRPKDKIVGVGQADGVIEDVLHLPLDKTVRKIRGKKGTKVVLQVISGSDPSGTDTRLIDLIRDDVKLEEQAATSRVERVTLKDGTVRNIGVVRLPAFYRTFNQKPGTKDFRSATEDVATEIAKLNNENIEGLILDLRYNGGGALPEAVNLTGLFVKQGPVVQVREPRQIQVLPIQDTGIAGPMFRKPMITLVNRTSASASEIVAGALQDYGRSLIVGDSKTHGKGTVQTVLPLGGRFGDKTLGEVKLTTATFYRITGASTQLRGVVPDIIIPSTLDTLEIGEEYLPNPLPWTMVDAAYFSPVFTPTNDIVALKKLSDERLASDAKYQRYHRLVGHLAKLSKESSIPLEYNARKAYAIEEREMRKLQDLEISDFEAPAEDDDLPKKKNDATDDIIMQESLQILSDYITLTGGKEVPLSSGESLQKSMFRIFGGY